MSPRGVSLLPRYVDRLIFDLEINLRVLLLQRCIDHRRRDSSPPAIFGKWKPLNSYSSYYHGGFSHGRSLRGWLADDDARYTEAVQERLGL